MKKNYDALVVGAGIGGIRSALDLAETGRKVLLVDSKATVGGLLTQLDHQFPTDHCGMCKMLPLTERDSSSQFCMRKGLFHRNIDIVLNTELTDLQGDPGEFKASLTRKSSFVDPHKCIGCGECSEVCPVRVDSEFNAGLVQRAAIHLPVPHAIPNHYVVDLDNCQRCWKCHDTCPTKAIDFRFQERGQFQVLVADPDKASADALMQGIEDLGFPMEHIATGEAVIERMLAKEEKGAVRLLLLNLALEEPGPERVLTRCLEIDPRLNVVLLGEGPVEEGEDEPLHKRLLDLGAREHVDLPLAMKSFKPWLDKLFMRIVSDEVFEVDVAAVILAAGFECFDPTEMADVLGYRVYPGVVTSLEFERMISGSGARRLVNPKDGGPVRRIAWLQCVGSRDIQRNADFCSSICCMISIKEANLARKMTLNQEGGPAETTIFYMDMRVFGKDYQRYLDVARFEGGLRLVRARIHSVLPVQNGEGNLKLQYVDQDGKIVEEVYDMLVLAVGGRPPKSMERLARSAGIEVNDWGFCKTLPFEPARTSRLGVFAAGSFAGPKDITETLIQSSAAALGASRLINLYAPLKENRPDPPPEYRDVSRERPRILAALCTSCPVLEQGVDLEGVRANLAGMEGVKEVVTVGSACTEDGWTQITERAKKLSPNRVLIGACMPYAYVPKLHELGRMIGLRPSLMDVVDIYTPAAKDAGSDGGEAARERVMKEIGANLRRATVRLMGADPVPKDPPDPATPNALVVGGGLAGLTAAHGIADMGYEVYLVEEGEELGGQARNIRRTLDGEDPVKFVEDLVEQVSKHPNVRIFTDARVALSMGRAGRFLSVISTDQGGVPVEHGAVILATGGKESKIYDWGFRVHKTVLTHNELEQQLADGVIDAGALDTVAMIQCWRSRDEDRDYCSRICCQMALKNVLELKRRNPDLNVFVFYRDIMSYGFLEQFYTEARRAGAIFVSFDPESPPRVSFEDGKPVIKALDPISQRELEVHADLLSLASGIEPNDVSELVELFGVEVDRHGFFQEAEPKWRPVDFLKQGVFMCGLARAPGNMGETIGSAKAAAQRALRVLSEKHMVSGNVVAEVRQSLCSLCGKCIEVCAFGARSIDITNDRIVIDELLCQGCGSCAAVCPNSASILRGFTDGQVLSEIDAALEELV